MRILLTGGSGLLGTELLKIDPELIAPTSREMNITSLADIYGIFNRFNPEIVIHAAAYTKPFEHAINYYESIHINIIGTANMALVCADRRVRLVYLSTDYLYQGKGLHKETEGVLPTYNFAWSKLGGECSVAEVPNHLILRLSFGERPFPHEKVYDNQINSKLYVDEIAPMILKAAKSQAKGIMNIGGKPHSLLEYARQTRPDIETIPTPEFVPKDTSLDISKYESEVL